MCDNNNYSVCERLCTSFIKFLDSKNIKYPEYKALQLMSTEDKLTFIEKYIKPKKNCVDTLIIDTMEKYGDKPENYAPDDIDKLKRYLEAFAELI